MTIRRALKNIAKKILPEKAVQALSSRGPLGARKLGGLRALLTDPVPFDNRYQWLNYAFARLIKNPRCKERPQYAWGVLQGAALAKVLRIPRISVIEFGVAGGFGLLALESAAEMVASMTNVGIDVFGFDTGIGLPRPQDIRDQPNLWVEGQLPMDRDRLQSQLKRASLRLGLVKETVPSFLSENPSPVAFVSFDLDLYSSTSDALALFQSDYQVLLPRVISYFDDIYGLCYNDFCGERLALREFNDQSARRQLCPIYGLRYFLPRSAFFDLWPDGMYFAHFFEHPLYGMLEYAGKGRFMPVEGGVLETPESRMS
jgi:hypothetical protein